MSEKWPQEITDYLLELFNAREHTRGELAAILSARLKRTITRNAVIGKICRLGLSGPRPRPRPKPPRQLVNRPAPRAREPMLDEPAPTGPLDTFGPRHTCKWIHGDPRVPGWRECGAPVERPSDPWCAHHSPRITRRVNASQASSSLVSSSSAP